MKLEKLWIQGTELQTIDISPLKDCPRLLGIWLNDKFDPSEYDGFIHPYKNIYTTTVDLDNCDNNLFCVKIYQDKEHIEQSIISYLNKSKQHKEGKESSEWRGTFNKRDMLNSLYPDDDPNIYTPSWEEEYQLKKAVKVEREIHAKALF